MAPIAHSFLSSSSASTTTALSSLLSPRTPLSVSSTTTTSSSLLSSSFHNFLTLAKRQTSNDPAIIPTTYESINSGLSPGTVVGAVLGSVGGFLLILWLIYTCLNFGQWSGSTYSEDVVVARRKSRGSRSSRRVSETVEVRRAASPVRVSVPRPAPPPERVARVVVEERRETRRERDRGGSDEVVVIEEHSPPRRKSKREKRESGGYRTVDPLAYGGVVGGRRA